ncbi:MAG: nucleotidyltransferase family protein, partial [Clostridia bacterium]|nr:nucleotidyltransferase family protein [Clostridia bacterium]
MTQKQLQTFLLALIRSALCGEPVSVAADEAAIRAVCALARRQDVLSMATSALQENGYALGAELTRRQYTAVWRSEQMTHELGRIGETLQAAGIPYIPLKGAVIRDLYPAAWMRVSADIDLLVHEDDLPRAVSALSESLGYRAGHQSHHDITLTAPSGQTLELHFNLREKMERLDAVLDTVWEYAEPAESGAFRLNPDFLVFHVLAHL